MNINAAEKMILKDMESNGLLKQGWVFKWDRATRRFGACHSHKQMLTMSKPITELNDEPHVKNTILHEIAHALASYGGERHGHDDYWKTICIAIGGDGARCYSSAVTRVPRTKRVNFHRQWVGTCPNCGHKTRPRSRRGTIACGRCCRQYANNKFDAAYLFVWAEYGHKKITINGVGTEKTAHSITYAQKD